MATLLGMKNKSTVGSRAIYRDSLLGTRKQFTDTYIVQADSLSETEEDIMAADGIPDLRSISHNAYCRELSAREIDSGGLLWELDAIYDSHIDADTQVIRISWEGDSIEELITHDQVTGESMALPNGEVQPVTTIWELPVLVVERIEDTFDPDIILTYSNTVNSTPFYGAPAGCALMKGPYGAPEEVSGQQKYRVTYRIKFNLKIHPDTQQPEGWFHYQWLEGNYYYTTSDPNTRRIKQFLTAPPNVMARTGPLNFDGTARTQSDTDDDGLPLLLLKKRNRFRIADFSFLNLGP